MGVDALIVGLIVIAVVFFLIIVWLIWTTINIRGSFSRTSEFGDSETTKRINRLDAEIFVETIRAKDRIDRQ